MLVPMSQRDMGLKLDVFEGLFGLTRLAEQVWGNRHPGAPIASLQWCSLPPSAPNQGMGRQTYSGSTD